VQNCKSPQKNENPKYARDDGRSTPYGLYFDGESLSKAYYFDIQAWLKRCVDNFLSLCIAHDAQH
jgi:hypothetical protein